VSSTIAGLLYEVDPADTAVFVMAAIGLAAVAIFGYALPAVRAARVEPVAALRY
jgi:ABC-type antimicrobial peptide transport system permease subunit